ncbi:hypothetical protein JXA80_09010, partial [bacterium]|nr:hypothetical protein [candidate division CSSED10-310 bacterium]
MMTRSVKHLIGLDTLVFILTAIVSLEMNLPYALDQLAFHKAMHWMGSAATWLCPFGDRNPLILMGDSFVPYKLMIRTMTLAILVIWILIDLRGRGHSVKSFLIAGLIIGHVLIPQAMLIRARLAADNHALAH